MTTWHEVGIVRLSFGEVERLSPAPFVCMAGMIGGVLLRVTGSGTKAGAAALAAVLVTWGAAVSLWTPPMTLRLHGASRARP